MSLLITRQGKGEKLTYWQTQKEYLKLNKK